MYLDWIAGILELYVIYTVGNKNRWGWLLGVLCCFIWILYIVVTKSTYGMLPTLIPVIVINIRNFIKWSEEDKS